MWHLSCDTWLLFNKKAQEVAEKSQKVPKMQPKKLQKNDQKYRKVFLKKRRDFIVSVLLSANAEIVGVSHMKDFKDTFFD